MCICPLLSLNFYNMTSVTYNDSVYLVVSSGVVCILDPGGGSWETISYGSYSQASVGRGILGD